MEKIAKRIFFLGKGGVGKSTSAALTAIALSKKGFKVLLVSLDPAHNQSDIFEKKFGEKPVSVNENLKVSETDVSKWTEKYLNEIRNQVKRSYSYLTAFNLENYFDILKYSPGIDEYSLLLAYKELTGNLKNTDFIVFDMPPTAVTLKFLLLPDLSLKWVENLLELRKKILEKKEIISKVKFGKKEIETDKISSKLNRQIESYGKIKAEFRDKKITVLNLVMNTDKLSFSESKLITEKLNEYNLKIDNIFLNKAKTDFDLSFISKEFPDTGFQILPESKEQLTGYGTLVRYLNSIDIFKIIDKL